MHPHVILTRTWYAALIIKWSEISLIWRTRKNMLQISSVQLKSLDLITNISDMVVFTRRWFASPRESYKDLTHCADSQGNPWFEEKNIHKKYAPDTICSIEELRFDHMSLTWLFYKMVIYIPTWVFRRPNKLLMIKRPICSR